jgi:hypothetical protein
MWSNGRNLVIESMFLNILFGPIRSFSQMYLCWDVNAVESEVPKSELSRP